MGGVARVVKHCSVVDPVGYFRPERYPGHRYSHTPPVLNAVGLMIDSSQAIDWNQAADWNGAGVLTVGAVAQCFGMWNVGCAKLMWGVAVVWWRSVVQSVVGGEWVTSFEPPNGATPRPLADFRSIHGLGQY